MITKLQAMRDERDQVLADLAAAQAEVEQLRRVFTRRDVEGMSREQLVSLAAEAISEARRKGLLEAEGLLAKHRELLEETDLELMRGLVTMYNDRIKVVEAERARRQATAAAPAKLDTRPLIDKVLDHQRVERNTSWWDTGFTRFDARAKEVAEVRKTVPGVLVEGQPLRVMGDAGTVYTLERKGDIVSCSCPSWEHTKGPTNRRTCKHLKRHLGEEAELKRVSQPQPSCWCGVVLVRGQCQIHTRDWKGDERCNCGRLFSFCKEEFRSGRAATAATHEPRLAGTPEPERIKKAREGIKPIAPYSWQ